MKIIVKARSSKPLEVLTRNKRLASKIYNRLQKRYGSVVTPLKYEKPHELAIAVILSAQCTDIQVNRVTAKLFEEFSEPRDFYETPENNLEEAIRSTGFYRNKAKNIRGFCRRLIREYNSVIPDTLEDLTKFPGMGRKSANVVIQELYGIAKGIVVDTHVSRISRRFHFTKNKNPVKIERDLMEILPHGKWRNWSLYLIFLGREWCRARNPECAACILNRICPSATLDTIES